MVIVYYFYYLVGSAKCGTINKLKTQNYQLCADIVTCCHIFVLGLARQPKQSYIQIFQGLKCTSRRGQLAFVRMLFVVLESKSNTVSSWDEWGVSNFDPIICFIS